MSILLYLALNCVNVNRQLLEISDLTYGLYPVCFSAPANTKHCQNGVQ